MTRPRLLDLFCGAGGAAVGYSRAGFDVVGVDLAPQKNYPFPFVQADALLFLRNLIEAEGLVNGQGWGAECGEGANATGGMLLGDFDVVHASPPCQGYSRLRHLPWLKGREWPRLIEPLRVLLWLTGLPWIMENVEDAPMGGLVLCGRMFDLPVYRHRRFESSHLLLAPTHEQHTQVIGHGRMVNDRRRTLRSGSASGSWGESEIVTVAGGQFKKQQGIRALGIDWMTVAEMCQAIPPAYTEYLGRQLLRHLEVSR